MWHVNSSLNQIPFEVAFDVRACGRIGRCSRSRRSSGEKVTWKTHVPSPPWLPSSEAASSQQVIFQSFPPKFTLRTERADWGTLTFRQLIRKFEHLEAAAKPSCWLQTSGRICHAYVLTSTSWNDYSAPEDNVNSSNCLLVQTLKCRHPALGSIRLYLAIWRV